MSRGATPRRSSSALLDKRLIKSGQAQLTLTAILNLLSLRAYVGSIPSAGIYFTIKSVFKDKISSIKKKNDSSS